MVRFDLAASEGHPLYSEPGLQPQVYALGHNRVDIIVMNHTYIVMRRTLIIGQLPYAEKLRLYLPESRLIYRVHALIAGGDRSFIKECYGLEQLCREGTHVSE